MQAARQRTTPQIMALTQGLTALLDHPSRVRPSSPVGADYACPDLNPKPLVRQ